MDNAELVMTITVALVGMLLLLANARLVKQAPDSTIQRLARIERKLDAIIAHLHIEVEQYPPTDSSIEELLRAGKIIDAVKAYREANEGASLREAKLAVDDLKARLNVD
jgi:ribosomal protein L7/L12